MCYIQVSTHFGLYMFFMKGKKSLSFVNKREETEKMKHCIVLYMNMFYVAQKFIC